MLAAVLQRGAAASVNPPLKVVLALRHEAPSFAALLERDLRS